MAAPKASTSNDVVRRRPKLLDSESLQPYLCVFCKSLLYVPYQSICGDRACDLCLKDLAKKINDNGLSSTRCPGCGDQISHEQFFPDKAATRELNALSVSCPNEGCQWEGLYKEYFETHLGAHYKMYDQFPIKCTEGCGEEIPRGSLNAHLQNDCTNATKSCCYASYGCQFEGFRGAVVEHEANCLKRPLILIFIVGQSGSLENTVHQLLSQVIPGLNQTSPPEPFLSPSVEETLHAPCEPGHERVAGH